MAMVLKHSFRLLVLTAIAIIIVGYRIDTLHYTIHFYLIKEENNLKILIN